MRRINIDEWPRRAQFELYRKMDFPYVSLTAQVKVGGLKKAAREADASFTVATMFLICRAANEVDAFKTRIRGDEVVIHETVHPSITVLGESDQLGFCTIHYVDEFSAFRDDARRQIAIAREQPSLADPPGKDDMLFMSSMPWVAFSGMVHPVPLENPDSIPRIAWGKVGDREGGSVMPISVQANHAVMDGVHIGRFFERLESLLVAPEIWLSGDGGKSIGGRT